MKLITVTLLLLLSMKTFSAEANARSDKYVLLDPSHSQLRCTINNFDNFFSIYIRDGEKNQLIFRLHTLHKANFFMSQCNAIIIQAKNNKEKLLFNISPANDVTDLTNILIPENGFYQRVIDQLEQINPKPKFPECPDNVFGHVKLSDNLTDDLTEK